MNAAIYLGGTVLGNVKDVTLSLETGEADITTRANQGWRATAATLRECTAEWQMVWKEADAGLAAIRTAWLNNETVEMEILTAPKEEAGSEGPVGKFVITNFSRNEALEEAITYDVSAKLAEFEEWYIGDGT